MEKKELTPDKIFEKEAKKGEILGKLALPCFIVFLLLSAVCLYFAIRNSIGNVAEIIRLLDNKAYTGEELRANYQYLIEKYGKWTIGNGGAGFDVTFINIGKALFSGLAIINFVFSIVFFASAFVFGKFLFPKISQHIEQKNDKMFKVTVLRNQKKE